MMTMMSDFLLHYGTSSKLCGDCGCWRVEHECSNMNVARGTENVQIQVWIDGIVFFGMGYERKGILYGC